MKKKLFKKLLTIGLLLTLVACIFSGCASTGGDSNEPPGILTITGISAEYEGKFISADIFSIPDPNGRNQVQTVLARAEPTAVMNGEVKLPFYIAKVFGKGSGYAGTDPVDVKLEIFSDDSRTIGKLLSRAVFPSTAFKDGVAEVRWNNALKPVYITVTNIPEMYNQGSTIGVGQNATRLPLTTLIGFNSKEASGSDRSIVSNGTTTVPVLPSRGSAYKPFPERGTIDIVVGLTPRSSGSGVTIDHQFLFTAVLINNGKAVIDFRNGIRQ